MVPRSIFLFVIFVVKLEFLIGLELAGVGPGEKCKQLFFSPSVLRFYLTQMFPLTEGSLSVNGLTQIYCLV